MPTGQPAANPKNHDFAYQRFQRSILLADTFKSVLLAGSSGLAVPPPADVGQELHASPYLGLYDPTKVDAVSLLLPGSENIPRVGRVDKAAPTVWTHGTDAEGIPSKPIIPAVGTPESECNLWPLLLYSRRRGGNDDGGTRHRAGRLPGGTGDDDCAGETRARER